MLRRIGRLFVIKTRWEVIAVIYALALGSVDRGMHYVERFPGFGGWLLFAACTGVVFMAGAKLFDSVRPDTGERRRNTDPLPAAAAPRRSPLRPVVRRGSTFLLSRRDEQDSGRGEARRESALG